MASHEDEDLPPLVLVGRGIDKRRTVADPSPCDCRPSCCPPITKWTKWGKIDCGGSKVATSLGQGGDVEQPF